jgi:hypothetical protein
LPDKAATEGPPTRNSTATAQLPGPERTTPLRAAAMPPTSASACSSSAPATSMPAICGAEISGEQARNTSMQRIPPYQANTVAPASLPRVIGQGSTADMRCPSQVRPRTSAITASPACRVPHTMQMATNSMAEALASGSAGASRFSA